MTLNDILKDKILKMGNKQKLDPVVKYVKHPDEDIRVTVAIALGMIPTYDSGMALITLLRDSSALVRATACESAAKIRAKNCEEYLKKLSIEDADPNVKQTAKRAYDQMKDKVA